MVEYHSAISHKDEQIEKLTASLQQSILQREEIKQHFKNEINQLRQQLSETSNLLQEHKCEAGFKLDTSDYLGEALSQIKASVDPVKFNNFKAALDGYLQNKIGSLVNVDKAETCQEMGVLDLKRDLEEKHAKEVEELRTYFEKKCADLEKKYFYLKIKLRNKSFFFSYSEEVFSQSRKMSGSSSCSELDLPLDFHFNQPGPGGDTKSDYSRKDLSKMRENLSQIVAILDRHNLNSLTDDEFDDLRQEIYKMDLKSLFKMDLNSIKSELQNKYHAELEILREDFDNRVDILTVEYESKLAEVQQKHLEEVDDLNQQLRGRICTNSTQEVVSFLFLSVFGCCQKSLSVTNIRFCVRHCMFCVEIRPALAISKLTRWCRVIKGGCKNKWRSLKSISSPPWNCRYRSVIGCFCDYWWN